VWGRRLVKKKTIFSDDNIDVGSVADYHIYMDMKKIPKKVNTEITVDYEQLRYYFGLTDEQIDTMVQLGTLEPKTVYKVNGEFKQYIIDEHMGGDPFSVLKMPSNSHLEDPHQPNIKHQGVMLDIWRDLCRLIITILCFLVPLAIGLLIMI